MKSFISVMLLLCSLMLAMLLAKADGSGGLVEELQKQLSNLRSIATASAATAEGGGGTSTALGATCIRYPKVYSDYPDAYVKGNLRAITQGGKGRKGTGPRDDEWEKRTAVMAYPRCPFRTADPIVAYPFSTQPVESATNPQWQVLTTSNANALNELKAKEYTFDGTDIKERDCWESQVIRASGDCCRNGWEQDVCKNGEACRFDAMRTCVSGPCRLDLNWPPIVDKSLWSWRVKWNPKCSTKAMQTQQTGWNTHSAGTTN